MKIYAYLAIAVLALGGLKWAHSTTYTAGWNAHQIEVDKVIATATQDALTAARKEWELTRGIAAVEIVIEERIVERIRIVEKEIPIIVEKIVEFRPECRDLGADFARLLNAQVDSRAGGTIGRTITASELDAAVPQNAEL